MRTNAASFWKMRRVDTLGVAWLVTSYDVKGTDRDLICFAKNDGFEFIFGWCARGLIAFAHCPAYLSTRSEEEFGIARYRF
jgi:hypothetical protein